MVQAGRDIVRALPLPFGEKFFEKGFDALTTLLPLPQPGIASTTTIQDLFGNLLSPQRPQPFIPTPPATSGLQQRLPPGPPPDYRIGDRRPLGADTLNTGLQQGERRTPLPDGRLTPMVPDHVPVGLLTPGQQHVFDVDITKPCPSCGPLTRQKGELLKSIETEQEQLQEEQVQQNQQQIQQYQQQETQQQQFGTQTTQQIEQSIQSKLQLLSEINRQIATAQNQYATQQQQHTPPGQPINPQTIFQVDQQPSPSVPPVSQQPTPGPQPSPHLTTPNPITFCITCESTADALRYQAGEGAGANCYLAT